MSLPSAASRRNNWRKRARQASRLRLPHPCAMKTMARCTSSSSHRTMPFPPTPSRPPFRSVGFALPAPEINRHLISFRTVHGYRATRILRTKLVPARTEYVRSLQRITVNINKAFKVKPLPPPPPTPPSRPSTRYAVLSRKWRTLDHQANLSRSRLYLVYIEAHDNISAQSRSFIRRPSTYHLHRLRVSSLISIYAGTLLQLSNNAHPCLESLNV